MPDLKIEVPTPHESLPKNVQQKWQEAYKSAYEEAVIDFPDDAIQQKQAALREANKTLRTPKLETYDDAMKLDSWHFVLRELSKDGKQLRVVTRHGKKALLDVPAKVQKENQKQADAGSSNAGDDKDGGKDKEKTANK